MSKNTDVAQFVQELGGGVVEEKLAAVLSRVAAAVVDHSRKGQIQVTFDISRIGDSYQVMVVSKMKFKRPTARGSQSEEDITSTPYHVGSGGCMTFYPEDPRPNQQQDILGSVKAKSQEDRRGA